MARPKRVVKQNLENIIRQMPAEDAAEVAAELAEATEQRATATAMAIADRIPGTIINGKKVPWTEKALRERGHVIVDFVSEETILLSWQNLQYQCIAGATCHAWDVFKQVYDSHRREMRASTRHLTETGLVGVIELGAGALPPRNEE